MTKVIVIEVEDGETAYEVGIGILGRAMDLHDNPDDDAEDVARELRDVGQQIIEDMG